MRFTDYSCFLFILSDEGIWTQTFNCSQPSISFIHSSIKSMRFCEQVINGREKVEKSFADNFFRIDESFMFLVAVIDLFIYRPVWILFSATLNIFWMSSALKAVYAHACVRVHVCVCLRVSEKMHACVWWWTLEIVLSFICVWVWLRLGVP